MYTKLWEVSPLSYSHPFKQWAKVYQSWFYVFKSNSFSSIVGEASFYERLKN